MKINKVLIFEIAACLLFAACSKPKDGAAGATGPAGPPGPSYTGAINGHVVLFDQYGSRVYTNLAAAQVSLNGAAPVSPDVNGYFMYPGITTGDYTMTGSAAGYASTLINKFQYLKDTLNRDIRLSAIPSFAPASLSVYPAGSLSGDSLVMTFSTDPILRNCIVFVSGSSAVDNTPAHYQLVYSKNIAAASNKPVTMVISAQELYNAGLTSGSTVYFAAYGYVINDASAYEDLSTAKTVYNAVSATRQTATAIVP